VRYDEAFFKHCYHVRFEKAGYVQQVDTAEVALNGDDLFQQRLLPGFCADLYAARIPPAKEVDPAVRINCQTRDGFPSNEPRDQPCTLRIDLTWAPPGAAQTPREKRNNKKKRPLNLMGISRLEKEGQR
jgi:hypothetical protein